MTRRTSVFNTAIIVFAVLISSCDENTTSPLRNSRLAVAASNSSAVDDIQPPTLVSLTFTPDAINTTTSEAQVQVTARITDDLSGVTNTQVIQFLSPTNGQGQQGFLVRTGGTALDGTYTATVTFPRFSEAGAWRVGSVVLYDMADNSSSSNTDALQALGFNTALQVTSIQDSRPPTLVSLSFTPTSINTSTGGAQVVVTARITDDLSGVTNTQVISFDSPTRSQAQQGFLVRTGGTALDGTYTATVTFPRFSEAGAWRVRSVLVDDMAGNESLSTTDALQASGFNTTLQVTGLESDDTPPETTILSAVDGTGAAIVNGGLTFSNSATLTLGGSDNVGVVGFQCSLDGTAYVSCSTPAAFSGLAIGSHTVHARALDAAGNQDLSPASLTWTVAVANHPPVANPGGSYQGSEGTAVSFDGRASTDPDGNALTYSWNFGDGTPAATGATPTHTYTDDGTYTVTLTVSDGTASTTATTTAIIANVAPALGAIAGATLLRGETFSGGGTFADPGLDTWTATVDYGDASGAQALVLSGKTFALSHVYSVAGTYAVTVTVTDDDGGMGSGHATVVVQSPQQAIQALMATIANLVATGAVTPGNGNALSASLQAAAAQLDRSNTTAAANQLTAFTNKATAMGRSGKLPADAAQSLIAAVGRILSAMNVT